MKWFLVTLEDSHFNISYFSYDRKTHLMSLERMLMLTKHQGGGTRGRNAIINHIEIPEEMISEEDKAAESHKINMLKLREE